MRNEVSSPLRYAAAVMMLVFGMWVGLKIPDADQSWLRLPSLIVHRSLLTHSLLIPAFLLLRFWADVKRNGRSDVLPRLGLMGLLLGLCVHFAFDLYPRQWYGFALVYVPLCGWMSAVFSKTWFVANLLIGLYLGCRLLRHSNELFLAFAVFVVAFVLEAQSVSSYGATAFYALLTLAAVGMVAFILPRPPVHPSAP